MSKLKRLIDNTLLLDISNYPGYDTFELSSGLFAKKFITIWELFDKIEELEECIHRLADVAHQIFTDTKANYTKIVTSTSTEQEIARHLIQRLYENYPNTQNQVSTIHFDNYFSINNYYNDDLFSRKENVIILTDIIASGSLVRKVAAQLENKGINVIGILSICISGEEIINAPRILVKQSERSDSEKSIPIHTLCSYPIKYLPIDTKIDADRIKKINPITVLPEELIEGPFQDAPLFSTANSFDHFALTNALIPGFYKFEENYLSCYFDIEKLLNHEEIVSNAIWEKIESIVLSCDVIVSTYRKEDLEFLKFVQTHLQKIGKELNSTITIKTDTKDTPHFFLTVLPRNRSKLAEKKVLLLMSTLTSSEKLRNISSLLLSYNVSYISALCLVNRMGPYTNSFINRIAGLVNGSEQATLSLESNFKLTSVYHFKELNTLNLQRVHESLEYLYYRYTSFSKVNNFIESFRRLKFDFLHRKYDMTIFANESIVVSDFEFNQEKIERNVESESELLYSLNYFTCSTRNYSQFVKKIVSTSHLYSKHVYLYLTGILISDVNFLRSTKILNECFVEIVERITTIRKERKNREDKFNKENVSYVQIEEYGKMFKTEGYLLLILSILSNYEDITQIFSHEELADFVLGTKEFENYRKYPIAYKYLVDDSEFFFALSVLIMGINNRVGFSEHLKSRLYYLRSQVEHFSPIVKLRIDHLSKGDLDYGLTSIDSSYVTNNIDLLRKELGEFDTREHNIIIRYLQNKAVKQLSSHNQLANPFKNLKIAFERDKFKDSNSNEVAIPTEIYEKIKIALGYSSMLINFAEVTAQFFNFHVGSYEDYSKYITPPNSPGFGQDIREIENLLGNLYRRKYYFEEDKDYYIDLYNRVFQDEILNCNSILFKSLYSYILSPYSVLLDALNDFSLDLKDDNLWTNALTKQVERIKAENETLIEKYRSYHECLLREQAEKKDQKDLLDLIQEKNFTCLCDSLLLRETIRNILSNILKHSGARYDNFDINISIQASEKIIESYHKSIDSNILISFDVLGVENIFDIDSILGSAYTINDHRKKIKQLGGNIHTKRISNDSYRISISLIARKDYLPKDCIFEETTFYELH